MKKQSLESEVVWFLTCVATLGFLWWLDQQAHSDNASSDSTGSIQQPLQHARTPHEELLPKASSLVASLGRQPSSNSDKQTGPLAASPLAASAVSHFKEATEEDGLPTIQKDSKGRAFRWMGLYPLEDEAAVVSERSVQSFLVSTLAPVLDWDYPEQLQPQGQVSGAHIFRQYYRGIPVEGAQVRVFLNERNQVFLVNSTFARGISQVPTAPKIGAADASQLATQHATSLDPDRREPASLAPELVIAEFPGVGHRLAWKIVVSQPHLGVAHGSGTYFVDASQGNVHRIERALN